MNLTVLGSSSSTLSPTTRDSYTSPSGQVWNASGVYLDTIPNMAGCDSAITIHLTVTTVDVSVTNHAPTLVANASGASYQWIYCDSISLVGETQQRFTATETGNYAVIVTENGCTDTSACETVLVDGVAESGWGFSAYPNPTDGTMYLDCGGYAGELYVQAHNALGQIVFQRWINAQGQLLQEIGGAAGIYGLDLRMADGQRAYLKVVKR